MIDSTSMAGDSDAERLDLSQELCTRVGMLFEDASVQLKLVGGLRQEELGRVVEEAIAVIGKAQVLLAAAAASLG